MNQPADEGKPIKLSARGEATRRRLLEAAEKEFGEKGFHAASVSSITLRADVSQGTFYLYFEGKEQIYTTLVREIGNAMRHHTAAAIAGPMPRLQAERAALEAFLDFTQRHPGMYRIVQEAQFVDEKVYRDYYHRVADGYTRTLAQAAQAGELAPGDPDVRAWAIMGIGHFLGLRYCLWLGQLPPPEVIDEVLRLIATGLAPAR